MRYLHTMVRVTDLDQALDFYVNKFGLVETRRIENEKGRFTLVFLALCAAVTLCAVWMSYRYAEAQREKIYVLDQGKSLMLALVRLLGAGLGLLAGLE